MKKIESVIVSEMESFLGEMIPQLGFRRTPIYRGQGASTWPLLPSLFRESLEATEFKTWVDLEASLLLALKQRSAGQLSTEPTNELEWMAIGQRHGLPTRFSAWTENALVALFFATENRGPDMDGVVWRLVPADESLTIAQEYEATPQQPSVYRPRLGSLGTPIQKLCYLSHNLPKANAAPEPLEECYRKGNAPYVLTRITIPVEAKVELRSRLATMGIDCHTLFPNLSGICGKIREDIYRHTDSYEWIFQA